MSDSILDSTKKLVGLSKDYDAFDADILMHINAVFTTLHQLGIGPIDGYMIEDSSATWSSYLGNDPRLNNVKSYMVLRVRMLFDPPATAFHMDAMNKQIAELEWRINVFREEETWVPPVATLVED